MADIEVREAGQEDNQALIELERASPMGVETVIALDRSPDFFARSKAYKSWKALVAEEAGELVGVGAVAFKRLRVAEKPVKAAYFYDLRVAPTHRRRGVASAIGDALRAVVRAEGVEMGYSLVMEGNVPSLEFVAKRGSRPVRRCLLWASPVVGEGPAGKSPFRDLEERDYERVARALGRCYSRHDLYPNWDAQGLKGLVSRACLGPADLRVWDDQGRVRACFGLWDYSSVMRMRFLRVKVPGPGHEEAFPRPGQELHQYFLLPLAFEGEEELLSLITEARRMVLERGGAQGAFASLMIPYDPEDSRFRPLSHLPHFEVGLQFFVLFLGGEATIGERPIYLDPVDL
ncbi:MAG: GNAT family N-acetyltransferase [candidate division NC10 bacterium]|nr:GNAT family N-acetyltransferase [candidate division NC10 bacterium]